MLMKIEKGIPTPETYPGFGRRYETKAGGEYPFPQMEIGDSFVVPADRGKAATVACARQKRKHGKQFATRKTEDGEFVRVWRIA